MNKKTREAILSAVLSENQFNQPQSELLSDFYKGSRCGFCQGLKNADRGLAFVLMKRAGITDDTIAQCRSECCKCHFLWC